MSDPMTNCSAGSGASQKRGIRRQSRVSGALPGPRTYGGGQTGRRLDVTMPVTYRYPRRLLQGVDDRIRTGDRLDHNQELYQLSYIHRGGFKSSESASVRVYRGFSRTRRFSRVLVRSRGSGRLGARADDDARAVAGDHRHVPMQGALGGGIGGD